MDMLAKTPNLVPSTSYLDSIQRIMFAQGDSSRPLPESAALVEEIVHESCVEILYRAHEVAVRRSSKMISLEDVLFVLRKSPIRIQRLIKYLSVKDTATTLQQQTQGAVASPTPEPRSRVKRCKDFISRLDSSASEGGILEQAMNGELHDEARMERLRRMDRMSRELTGRRYNDFTRARQVNFLGNKMKYPQKFHDWLTKDTATWMEPGMKVDKAGMEIFTYLAYESVGQMVEMSLFVRKEMERNRGGAITMMSVNPRYPMYQLPHLHTVAMAPSSSSGGASKEDDDDASPLRKRLKSGSGGGDSSDGNKDTMSTAESVRPPLRPDHVREAWRRLQHSPVGKRGLWQTAGAARVDARHQVYEERLTIIALGY
jgi:transcription initiation protein SPT3